MRRLAIGAESFLPLLAHPATVHPAGAGDPSISPSRPGSSERSDSTSPSPGPTLTVLAANLAQGVHDVAALAEAIAAVDADVACLVEHTGATGEALTAAGLEARWPHVADDRDEGYFGSMVASRHPIVTVERLDLGGRPGQVVEVDVAGTSVRVVPVHTQAPVLDRDVYLWRTTVEATAAVADGTPGPVVLAGDWNATGGHRLFRRTLRRHGLVDAQAVLGRRWSPTWPRPHPKSPLPGWFPALLPLDHVVVTPGVVVEDMATVALPGSDHLGLRAVLRLG